MAAAVPVPDPLGGSNGGTGNPYFTVAVNTDALSALLRAVHERIDKIDERARLYEDRSLQMLDALTETAQRLAVSESQYAAVFDTVTTLQRAVNTMVKDKLDQEVHHREVARLDEQLGQLRVSLDMVDARKQEIDVPALMRRVSAEARECSTKIIMERETESRRVTEALLHDKISKLTEEVRARTEGVAADAHAQVQNSKRALADASGEMGRRIDALDARARDAHAALENFAVKILLTENNIDALADVVREDVMEARQLAGCIAHAFGVNPDSLVAAVPAAERALLCSDTASESNTIRHWKWDRLDALRRQAVVDGWAPIRAAANNATSDGNVLRKLGGSVPASCPAVPDANTALAKRDELVRNAAKKRKEMLADKATQMQIRAAETQREKQQQQQQEASSDALHINVPDSGKLFLASPIFADVEARAVVSLRSDMNVLRQKVIADANTQIQQLDRVVRTKISFDQAKGLVGEAAAVESALALEPVKESVEALRRQVMMRDAALAMLAEKVAHSELREAIAPALDELQRKMMLTMEMQVDASSTAARSSLEKHVAALRERCMAIEDDVSKAGRCTAALESELRAVQLRAAASVSRGGGPGDDGRCLSCGNEIEGLQQQQQQQQQQGKRPLQRAQTATPQTTNSNCSNSARPQTSPNAATGGDAIATATSKSAAADDAAAAVHAVVAEGPSVRVLTSVVDDTSDRKRHGSDAAPVTIGGKSGAHDEAASASAASAGRGAMAPAPPGSAAFLKQQQQQQQQQPARGWMQEMDDRFQVRSLQPLQQNLQQSAAVPDAAAASSRSGTPAAGSGSRPTSARSRPLGAFNNVSSRRE